MPPEALHAGAGSSGAAQLLRSRGLRVTDQRMSIWQALTAESGTHLSAEELTERVQASHPGLHAATVYRTVDLFVDEGLVARTSFGGDRAYYEPLAEHPHHHVVCGRCGSITHLHDAVLGDLPRRLEAETGYSLGSGEITFHGLCPGCDTNRRAGS
jgi:Fur family transcriptional regulator, ferric uptake regulator